MKSESKLLRIAFFFATAVSLAVALTAPVSTKSAAGTKPPSPPSDPPASPQAGTVVRARSGIELVYVPPGRFLMGSQTLLIGAPARNPDELPVHQVAIREGFYMGKYEVTQAQWRSLMGASVSRQRDKANPSWSTAGEGDDYPVYYVNWDEAQEFIHRLNVQNDGFTYRLPSEAEWEYACRAGSTDSFASQPGPLDAMAWWVDNSERQSHPVGQKTPNAFGLYDLHGNVWEWCQDNYHDSYLGAPVNGTAWLGGSAPGQRVMRGGSWDYESTHLRSANRDSLPQHFRGNHVGFRVAAVARR